MTGDLIDPKMDKELYSILVDNAILGLAVIQNRKLIYANNALADITGHTKEELPSISPDSLISLVHPDDRNLVLEAVIEGLARMHLPLHQEFRILRKDGVVRWVDALANFIEYRDKPAVQISFLDITSRKLAEKALDATKEQYFLILESISDGFFALDENFVVTYFNNAAERLLGRKRSEVLGHNLFERLPEVKGSIFEDMFIWALKNKASAQFETYFGVKPYENWYDVWVYPKDNGISVFFQVITERKKAEQALRLSEERYRGLFETMTHGVVYQDVGGKILIANPAAARLLGLTIDQMQGRSSLDPQWKAIHEDGSDFPGAAHPGMIALTTGNVVENVIMGVFNPIDSEYKWLQISAVPQFLPGETKPYQVYAAFQDITEIKKAQDALKIKDASIESSTNAIIMADLAGNLIYVNNSFLKWWGYRKEEAFGKPIWELYQESQKTKEIIEEVYATRTHWSGESIATRKDGSTFDIQVSANMVEDTAGRPVYLVESFIDISKRKQAELALQASENKLKSLFDVLPIGMYIVDQDGKIVDANPAFETFMGLSKEELKKRKHWKRKYLFADGTPMPDPIMDSSSDLPAVRPFYDGKPTTDMEIGIVKEDGAIVWANANAIPLPFPDWRVVATILDITDKKHLEQDLKDREERFRKIFELSPIGIQQFSSKGVLIQANQSSLNILGWKDSKHAGGPNLLRDALEDEEIQQKLLSGQTWHNGKWISLKPMKAMKNEKDLKPGRNGRVYIDYSIVPLGESGQSKGYMVLIQDLTEQKMAEDAMISENERLQIIYELWRSRVQMSKLKSQFFEEG